MPIPSDGRAPQAFAALAAEATIAPLIQAFQAAKVPLAAIDLPELSQRNLAALFEEDGRGLATLIFDEDEGLLTFTLNGELLVVRHVEITARQLSTADEDRRGMLFERIALDVPPSPTSATSSPSRSRTTTGTRRWTSPAWSILVRYRHCSIPCASSSRCVP